MAWLFQPIPAGGVQASGVERTVTAGAGSYVLTGTAAGAEVGREVIAGGGSYALTGSAASLEVGREVVAAAGSYALTGADASPEIGREVSAGASSYALTGTDAALMAGAGATIVAEAGSYLLTGSAAAVEHGREVTAGGGVYLLVGTPASLVHAVVGGENERRGGIELRPMRRRRKYRYVTAQQLQEILDAREEEVPPPTPKRRAAVKREIVESVGPSAGLLGTARERVEGFVGARVEEIYRPGVDWQGLLDSVQALIAEARAEAERVTQELEDEDETLILMSA